MNVVELKCNNCYISMRHWLLLHYTLPSSPSARRVYIWRKLRRLGAILLNESVWVLPDTPRTAEQFQWLSVEILELKGDAYLWRSDSFFEGQENSLVEKFTKQTDKSYEVLLKRINGKNPDLAELSRQYQQIANGDYFHSRLGKQAVEKLISLRGEKS